MSAGRPTEDVSIQERGDSPVVPSVDELFGIPPDEALRLFSAGMEALIRGTGGIILRTIDGDRTAPLTGMVLAQTGNTVPTRARKSRLEPVAAGILDSPPFPRGNTEQRPSTYRSALDSMPAPPTEPVDGVVLRNRRQPEPTSNQLPLTQLSIALPANAAGLDPQQRAYIMRKLSARAPHISLTDYLARINRYCPMTTGVYLAASLYVHRVASAVVVTPRSAHRLVLAALSVACKGLEDGDGLPAQRLLAQVGGVGMEEMGRLEVYFCFLVEFQLFTRGPEMWQHYEWLKEQDGWARAVERVDNTEALEGRDNTSRDIPVTS